MAITAATGLARRGDHEILERDENQRGLGSGCAVVSRKDAKSQRGFGARRVISQRRRDTEIKAAKVGRQLDRVVMTTSVVIRFSVDRTILISWYGLGIFNARRGLPRRKEEHEGWAGMRVGARGGCSQRREDAKGKLARVG